MLLFSPPYPRPLSLYSFTFCYLPGLHPPSQFPFSPVRLYLYLYYLHFLSFSKLPFPRCLLTLFIT